ncbi:histidine phosphatase family protein [Candidatus Saccharibacteria bacterium]|nr:histidine phosphatase family protein [Candidatus Saccharibacteria bacterium]
MKIYLVRHGETEWNRLHKRQGRTDIPLNETGIKQAEELHDKLKDFEFDVCYSSPLSRARQTAEIVVSGRSEIIYDDRLMERSFGTLEGTDPATWNLEDDWSVKLNVRKKGMEPVRDLLARGRKILDTIIQDNKDDAKILIVAHNGILRAIHWNIVGYNSETNLREFRLKNTPR